MSKKIFKISFYNQSKIYELYAKSVGQSFMYGFLEVGELVFNNSQGILVDPQEERLKQEFNEVKSTYIPIHSVIRIDEVKNEGVGKIKELSKGDKGNVTTFPSNPTSIYTPEPAGDN